VSCQLWSCWWPVFKTRQHHLPRLKKAILDGPHVRFDHLFDDEDFISTAVCHPKFKLSWVDDPAEKAWCTHTHMLESVCDLVATDVQSDSENAQSTHEDHDQFFVLHHSSTSSASSQCLSYLSDSDRSLDMLSSYPKIKAVFIKDNTTLPSSVPVERLFSAGSIILSKRRNRLSDETFE